MALLHYWRKLRAALLALSRQDSLAERQLLATGKLLSDHVKSRHNIGSLADVEFRIFSQWGDDGIIQWLAGHVDVAHKTFIEFGVADYQESNTRFLLMNDNWSGFVMDGSATNVERIVKSDLSWRYDLGARCAFIDRDNINTLLRSSGFDADVGILHIDLDGVDYWIWKAMDAVTPAVMILEYNSVFGLDRAITVPYDAGFQRSAAHHSNLYAGASLKALHHLAQSKGYAFIGCNSAGNNAFFVRRDKLNHHVIEIALERGYVLSKFRESRDANGALTHARGDERAALIRGLPVYNVETDQVEPF